MALKIAIITDIHFAGVGRSGFDVRGLVDEFVDRAGREQVDLLLDLGDRIDDIDRAADLANATELARIFKRFTGRRLHLLGNHDVVNLTPDDHGELFGTDFGHHVVELGKYRVLAWAPSVLRDHRTGFPTAAPALNWLTSQLTADVRPAIIASHIPVSGAAMTSNYYFEHNEDLARYPDHAAIRHAVEETGRAALWLAGHVHWNSASNVAGIRHLTIQSASETFTTMPDPACSYALLEIDGPTARLQVLGRDPLTLSFPFAASDNRPWPPPRPRVARP
jgi:3',5'-cyclic-AMP phosphodiesterase